MADYETTLSPPVISHPAPGNEGNETTGTARTRPSQQTTDDGAVILAAHCSNVAERAVKLYYENVPQNNATISQEAVLFAASSMHDFGKVTPQFQAHVRPDETHSGSDREKNHARLGALATWFLLSHAHTTDRDALAGTLAVARHHQALPNTATYTVNTLIPAFTGDVIQTQLDAINETWPDEANELLQLATTHLQIDTTNFPQDTLWEAFYEWASDDTATRALRELAGKQELTRTSPAPENLPDKTYDRMLHYWGALTLADKTHASGTRESRVFNFDTLDIDGIDEYVDKLRRTPADNEHEATLNDERERARRQAIRGVHEFTTDTTTDVATLTLPTGLGKTLTGLSAAFETRNTLQTKDTTPWQIIYALPHTSIIEQTRKLFENPELWGADPEKSALTVHHYLSNTVVTENDDTTDDVATTDGEHDKLLGEAWRSGTILTTFVQLFESITGPTNNSGLKLSSLQNAVIILDEPQAIPKHWWGATNRLFTVLTEEFNATLIGMTATKPSLFKNTETTPLLQAGKQHDPVDCEACTDRPNHPTTLTPKSKQHYFNQTERVTYTIDETAASHSLHADENTVPYDTAAQRIINATETGESTLAVCNTIASSATLTDAIQNATSTTHLGATVKQYLDENNITAGDSDTEPGEIAREVLRSNGFTIDTDTGEITGVSETDTLFIVTFNSRFRPFDRRILLELLSVLSTTRVKFACVATQAIEAGVDVSFKNVFRDIAPVDSIVQAAGRCNRGYEWGVNGGKVVVWTLATPDNNAEQLPAAAVYGGGEDAGSIHGHLRVISDVLAEHGTINQETSDVNIALHAVTAYFDDVHEKSFSDNSIQEYIDQAKVKNLLPKSLIRGGEKVDVIVSVSDSDEELVEWVNDGFQIGDSAGFERLQRASELRVSLPKRFIESSQRIQRVDNRSRGEDGVQVFVYSDGEGLTYELGGGGVQLEG